MAKNRLIVPFLKWVGGKRQLIPEIKKLLPEGIRNRLYIEPFVGAGALFFELQPKHAIINDFNIELINVYEVIRDHPEELITALKEHKNTSEYFYNIRAIDRQPLFNHMTVIEKASRTIYLNKTCYNGLYRVNNAGEFNSPLGRYKNPNIVNAPVIKAVSRFLNDNDITIKHGDYEALLSDLPEKSFVYLDPPYHPISESSNFTGYIQGGWNVDEQIRLRNVCNSLNERGIQFLLSNSATPLIEELYSEYNMKKVRATRSVNSISSKRGQVDEYLIYNYNENQKK